MVNLADGFLDGCRDEFEKGNKWALMQALSVCSKEHIPLPGWAAQAFIDAVELARIGRVRTWDELFGKTFPDGQHLNAYNKRQEKLWPVYYHIRALTELNPDTAVDAGLFEAAGKKFGIGKTLASEYYYEAKRILKRFGFDN